MTLPGTCPICKSHEVRTMPSGHDDIYQYSPPTVNLRKVGKTAGEHNRVALERIKAARNTPPVKIVVCANCGCVYAREMKIKPLGDVLTSKPTPEAKGGGA